MSVQLIEPNSVNINKNIVNGIPQYQDMYIFAELTAVRKARTVLVTTGDNMYHAEKTGLENGVRVNFIGVNQSPDNPNYLNFTTNYYDGSSGNQIQYEGFGIQSIKAVINSSFVPQVNITFVDLRGLAFFNQENSPYRILFDFPPPIFTLTIKGYYGKALEYQLHLVKYTSEFKAENGNFIIDAQFIAVTYAPLTDVLFRYIVNFPLMISNSNSESMTPAPETPPKNTFELITKLKNLYPTINEKIKSDSDSAAYDASIAQIEKNTTAFTVLSNYQTELGTKGTPYALLQDNSDPAGVTLRQLNNVLGFEDIIKDMGVENMPTKINQRLIVGYLVGPDTSRVSVNPDTQDLMPSPYDSTVNDLKSTLNAYRQHLLRNVRGSGTAITINDTDVSEAIEIYNNYDISTNRNSAATIRYVGIDITDLFVKLYKNRFELEKQKTSSAISINIKINNIIQTELGMLPTIYNIFKVILDDVDTFFETIRKVSNKAENEHHNIPDYKKIILGDPQFGDTRYLDKIFAFPLIINRQAIICGGNREERIAPIELSKKLPQPFPEMKMVEDFIDTFFMQEEKGKLGTMKSEQNDDGTNKWIPISPFDSELGSPSVASPYINVDNRGGSGPINTSSDDRLAQIIKIVLQRFYILSQNSLSENFYENDKIGNAYVDLYAQSEAVNLASSIYNPTIREGLKKFSDSMKGNLDGDSGFYKYLDTMANKYYDFSKLSQPSFPISSSDNAYVYKNNSGYTGVYFPSKDVAMQVTDNGKDKPIDKFLKDVKTKGFWRTISGEGRYPESFYVFTKQNVLYIKDELFNAAGETKENKMDKYDDICLKTRFLADTDEVINPKSSMGKAGGIDYLLSNGNYNIGGVANNLIVGGDSSNLKDFDSIVDIWVNQLSQHDDEIIGAISGMSKLSAIILLSNFGYALGPFNVYPKNLGRLVFNNPAAIDMPTYLAPYIGGLVDADDAFKNELKNFFLTGAGKNLDSNGMYIFADIFDVNNNLSANDKKSFKAKFDTFYNNQYADILSEFNILYQRVKSIIGVDYKEKTKRKTYEKLLDPTETGEGGESYFKTVLQPLIQRIVMANYSQLTFTSNTGDIGYISLHDSNRIGGTKKINDKYFTSFFNKLSIEIPLKERESKEEEEKNKKLKGDEDVISQTYYSFKNINDKWLSNPVNTNVWGYPFNENGKHLIGSFVFIDRAMNPIGDTMINPESLIDFYNDTNVSVFSVLTQLLSANGFEFFPLQNFMSYTNEAWENSFKIDTGPITWHSPTFVCMLIGGTSSYPTGMDNGFADDGITDIGNTDATDFNTKDCPVTNFNNDNQTKTNPDFPWRQVKAFKVRFGEQNQSMFTDIKIDSKEYPETNESIQILSRLAGDNGANAPIPKGQNLYNLYENRAYRATVTGMGNAMIQPTQYFQLENVPLFNGAYLILTVEHDISANKMMTAFSGTKILRYPVPRVLNPAAIFGFMDGSSSNTSISSMSAGDIIIRTQAITMSQPRLTQLDSVFGIDVSYAQGVFDWNKAVNPTNSEDPKPKFAMIKASQGTTITDDQVIRNASGAKAVGLKTGYYHYAQQYSSDNPENDAKAQAAHFIGIVRDLPKSDFPLILDMENYEKYNKNGILIDARYWSKNKANNDKWINTFISELKNAGYDTILYGNKPWFSENTSNNFGSHPLWHAQYPTHPASPEMTNPTVANGWIKNGLQNWTAWQFSSQGMVNGYNNIIDINVMKKDYFDSHKA